MEGTPAIMAKVKPLNLFGNVGEDNFRIFRANRAPLCARRSGARRRRRARVSSPWVRSEICAEYNKLSPPHCLHALSEMKSQRQPESSPVLQACELMAVIYFPFHVGWRCWPCLSHSLPLSTVLVPPSRLSRSVSVCEMRHAS